MQCIIETKSDNNKKKGKVPERPPGPIEALEGANRTHYSIEIEWEEAMKKATEENDNKRIRVTLQERDKHGMWNNLYSGYSKRHICSSLEPWSPYTYRLRFQSNAGPSEWSSEITITTKKAPLSGEHLHKAIAMQNRTQLESVLNSGDLTSVDTVDKFSFTPLMQAAQKGYDEFITDLVDHGADVNYQNDAGKTALMLASYTGRMESVKELRHHGAKYNIHDKGGSTAFHWAMDGKNTEVIEWMIDDGADIEATDTNGWTPLLRVAAVGGDSDVAHRLLRHHACVNCRDKDGKTPLMIAVVNGHQSLVQLLLEKGADISAKNEYGKTAYEMAISMERRRISRDIEEHMEKHHIKNHLKC